MGRRRYPPLSPREVIAIATSLGFFLKRTRGSHSHYEIEKGEPRRCYLITIDSAVDIFDDGLIKSMVRQSGVTREEFYGATPATAKKIR